MKVILLKNIKKLGMLGNIKEVKDGFARNYLLPKGLALIVNKSNLNYFNNQKQNIEARNLVSIEEAQATKQKMDRLELQCIRLASELGQLFGSVTSKDITQELSKLGFDVASEQVLIERPIKELGVYDITIDLYSDVTTQLTVVVDRSVEEANHKLRQHKQGTAASLNN